MGADLIDNPDFNVRIQKEKGKFKGWFFNALETALILLWLGFLVFLLNLLMNNLSISCFIVLSWHLLQWQHKTNDKVRSILVAQQKVYEVKIEFNFEALIKHPSFQHYWTVFKNLDEKLQKEVWENPERRVNFRRPFHFIVTYNFIWCEHFKQIDTAGFAQTWRSDLAGGCQIHENYLFEKLQTGVPEPEIHFTSFNGCLNFKIDTFKAKESQLGLNQELESRVSLGEFPIAVVIPYLINRVERQEHDSWDPGPKEERQRIDRANEESYRILLKNREEFYKLDEASHWMERGKLKKEIIEKHGFKFDEKDIDAEFGGYGVYSNGIVKVKIKEWDKVAF